VIKMAPCKTQTAGLKEEFKVRKLRSSSLSTPKKQNALEENIAPNSEVKVKRAARITRVKDATVRGVSPVKSPIKKKSSELSSSPLKSIQLNRVVSSPKKVSAQTKLFDENLKNNAIKKKSSEILSSPLKLTIKLDRVGDPRIVTSPKKLSAKTKLFEDVPKTLKTESPKQLYRNSVSRFGEAKKCLSLSHPDQVVGREEQIKVLRNFLETNLTKNKKSKTPRKKCYKIPKRSIYVSGPPGTGKTTCLKRLIGELPLEDNNVRVLPIVNCMTIGTSGGIYGKVVDALCPRKSYSSAIEAQKILETEVISSKQTILLILDEIDQLDSKSQEVLYTLFELPYLNESKLVLVGIANALDLTDRILPRLKLQEGFSPKELTFPAYSTQEILAILKSRLSGFLENSDQPVFTTNALKILSMRIGAVSGDIRKALDVCERALQLAEKNDRLQTRLKTVDHLEEKPVVKLIDVPDIMGVLNNIYSSTVTVAMKNGSNDDLPLQQKLLIATLLLMSNHRKCKDITLGKLHATYIKVCKKRGLGQVDLTQAHSLCGLLESRGILSMKLGPMSKWASSTKDKKVSLRIDEGEIEAALKDKHLLSGILKDVDCVAK